LAHAKILKHCLIHPRCQSPPIKRPEAMWCQASQDGDDARMANVACVARDLEALTARVIVLEGRAGISSSGKPQSNIIQDCLKQLEVTPAVMLHTVQETTAPPVATLPVSTKMQHRPDHTGIMSAANSRVFDLDLMCLRLQFQAALERFAQTWDNKLRRACRSKEELDAHRGSLSGPEAVGHVGSKHASGRLLHCRDSPRGSSVSSGYVDTSKTLPTEDLVKHTPSNSSAWNTQWHGFRT